MSEKNRESAMRSGSTSSPAAEVDTDFQATRDLIKLGLEMVETGMPTISPEAIHAWMLAPTSPERLVD